MATGHTCYPNQVNNVLDSPFIVCGAIDVKASCINTEMLALHAICNLARQPRCQEVLDAYQLSQLSFGKDYILFKTSGPRLVDNTVYMAIQSAKGINVARG